MDGGGGGKGGTSFGAEGSPGFVSPFDLNAVQFGQGQAETGMADRYAQLGLSARGASPGSAGGLAGGIGVGNIGHPLNFPQVGPMAMGGPNQIGGNLPAPGSADMFGFPGGGAAANTQFASVGTPGGLTPTVSDMPTAEQMDLGYAPSMTGGIPEEFQGVIGMIQNQALQNASMSQGGGGGGKGGGGKGAAGALMPLMMGGK